MFMMKVIHKKAYVGFVQSLLGLFKYIVNYETLNPNKPIGLQIKVKQRKINLPGKGEVD
jgi:hypothetical protein